MPFFKSTFEVPELDIDGFNKELEDAVLVQMRQAARAFARVAMAHIPVRTGFAQGSLGNITAKVGGGAVSNPGGAFFTLAREIAESTPQTAPKGQTAYVKNLMKKAKAQKGAELYEGVVKTPTSGRQFATQPSAMFVKEGNTYVFNYNVDIIYFTINDFFTNKFTPSAPWGSFEAGRATFINYMKTIGIKKLPQLGQFINVTEVKVDQKSLSTSRKIEVIRR